MNGADKKTVLVIDDDDNVLFLVEHALKRLGFHAVCTADGVQGLGLYRQGMEAGTPYAAVIMDLNLPGSMGARELIAPLLALDPAAKAFVTSGYPDDPCLTDYRAHGFYGALAKPITYKTLEETVVPSLQEDTSGT